jgi:hypothetical protein
MREYPNRIGLSLLKMHRDAVAEAETEAPAEDVDEVRERVINKLLRLKKRHEQE